MFKRLLSLVLSILMLVSAFAVSGLSVVAENNVVADDVNAFASYSDVCGDNLTWSLDTDKGVLTVTGTGDMYDYSYNFVEPIFMSTAPWWQHQSDIKSVVIGQGVTGIGDYAFSYCSNLVSISIADTVTSIGDYAFSESTALSNISFPDSVMSIGTCVLENTAYYNNSDNWDNNILYCGNHVIVVEPSLSGSCTLLDGTLSIADAAFSVCEKITSVTLPTSLKVIGIKAF